MTPRTPRPGPSRRLILAGAALAPFAPARAAAADAGRFEDPASQGRAGYSESAMIAFVDPAQRLAASLRVCRFPPMGHAWLWCHVLTPTAFLSYAHHLGACSSEAVFADPAKADFSTQADGATAGLVRTGSDGAVQTVDFDAAIDFRAATDVPLGPGAQPGRLTGRFVPTHLHQGKVDTGRREQIGRLDAVFEAAGRRYVLSGLGKYHEQAQTQPRFVDPFSYLAYWGPESSAVAIKSPRGDGGATLTGGSTAVVTGFSPEAPGPIRRATVHRAGAPPLEAEFEALVRFSFPIFGATWRGSFVRGRVGDDRVVGQFNDWDMHRLTYR